MQDSGRSAVLAYEVTFILSKVAPQDVKRPARSLGRRLVRNPL